MFTNPIQTFPQAARLNWCDIPRMLNTFKDNLQAKIENPTHPPTSNFARVQVFIDTARKTSSGRCQLRSYAEFELSDFVKPVISDLIGKTENAFDIAENLLGFSAIDPQAMPSDVIAFSANISTSDQHCFNVVDHR